MLSKWVIIVLVILAICMVLYVTGNKSVHNEIVINADREKVWNVLMDTDAYPSWNPVMKLLDGELKQGAKVMYQFTQDANNISKIPSHVKMIKPNELLNQKGGVVVLLTFDHSYILAPSIHGTKVTIHEDYKGIGVHFWNPKPVGEAYEKLNKALKAHVESLH